ncbi:MAG: MFS transporter [Chloroflexota bacterium]|nr:MFS transporter [Chloroflexota bacterium]MDQ5866328.1 MFS transporter [Chloroflexota bacterium]
MSERKPYASNLRGRAASLRAGASWRYLLTLYTVACLIEAMFWGHIVAFTPLYLPRLGIAPQDVAAWTGAITSISSLVGLPFLPFWGALADRYARQPVLVRAFVMHLLAGIIAMLAANVWLFLLARAVMSLSMGITGLMLTTLSERVPPGRTGLAFSILNSASPVGAFLGPLVGGPVVDLWGLPTLLAIDSVLMLGVVLSLTFGYQDRFKGTGQGSLTRMALGSVGLIWASRRLRFLFPALFLLFSGWMLANTYVPLVVTRLYNGADVGTATGLVIAGGGLTTMLFGPLLGALADRWGHWRVLMSSAGVSVLLWPLPALTGDILSFGIAWALVNGAIAGTFTLSFNVLADSTTPEARARVMIFSYLPVVSGQAIGPALGSFVTQISLFAVFPLAAALTATGIAAMLLANRQQVVGTPGG